MIRAVENCDYDVTATYDLVILTIGYEVRSSFLLRLGLPSAHRVVAFPFETSRIGAFYDNLDLFESSSSEIIETGEQTFESALLSVIRGSHLRRVAVDISSMTRTRLAAVIWWLSQAGAQDVELQVDFFYSPAMFVAPPEADLGALEAAPLPYFAGPLRRASLPVGAIIGLGYEAHRALGIMEFLEPSSSWLMSPSSTNDYEAEVASANAAVLQLVEKGQSLRYDISDAAGTYYNLDSLCFSAGESYRMVLVPMGPKIFAMASLLVGLTASEKRPAVWRVSEGARRVPLAAKESGQVIGTRVLFAP